jgi:hypothetical protein
MIYNESSDLHCLIICFIEKDANYLLPMNFFLKICHDSLFSCQWPKHASRLKELLIWMLLSFKSYMYLRHTKIQPFYQQLYKTAIYTLLKKYL